VNQSENNRFIIAKRQRDLQALTEEFNELPSPKFG
jgi:hypothetical protein